MVYTDMAARRITLYHCSTSRRYTQGGYAIAAKLEEPRSTIVTTRLTAKEAQRVKKLAETHQISMSDMLRHIINEWRPN